MIVKWVKEDWENQSINRIYGNDSMRISAAIQSKTTPDFPSINFQIYSATGGNIVEIQYYNETLDKTYKALHIIPGDQDLGEGISKIITVEMLKK
jgi:hypothetical protein